ncbi:MAG: lipid-A-disaccharide synthase [Gemmatimonadales bacterium]
MSAARRRILISAGEPSGDRLGGALVEAMLRHRDGLLFEGPGGSAMADAGVALRYPVEQLSAIGFLEVVGAVPRHLRLMRGLVRDAGAGRFALAILIDYSEFHLRLGARLRRAGVPVLWYVAPQLWAWAPGRIARLRAAADRIAAVLPFEEDWFASRGVQCTYVGHPLVDRVRPDRPTARLAIHLPSEGPILGIFPGSREGEIERNWPLFRDVAKQMLATGACVRAVSAATAGGYYPDAGPIVLYREGADTVMAASTAVLVKSGTTTLEAAIAGRPMVVAYRTSWLTHRIAERVLTVDHISLTNLVAGRSVVPEFWQWPVAAEPVATALQPLLDETSLAHQAQVGALMFVAERLGRPGASERVAALALELVGL